MGSTDVTSAVYRAGQTPVTRAAISTRAKIFSFDAGQSPASGNFTQIGVVSDFSPSHSRTIETRRGIGFGDKIAELIPQNADAVTISITRTMLYVSNIMQVFGYRSGTTGLVRSLAHHRFPFDIRHELLIPKFITSDSGSAVAVEGTTSNASVTSGVRDDPTPVAIVTLYEGCWFNDYNVAYQVDDIVLTESGTITVTDIYDPDTSTSYETNAFSTEDPNISTPLSSRFENISKP